MPVEYQARQPATPPKTTVIKTTSTVNGEVQHVNVDSFPSDAPLTVLPAPYHGSPFGGFRSAKDFLVMDNIHLYPGQATAYETDRYGFDSALGGTATHLPNESAIRLSVPDGTDGAKARLRTHDLVRYQAGASPHIKLTGYGSSGILYSVVRSSATGVVVDTLTEFTQWSENPAEVDVTNGNIYEFMYEWLGVGDIWFFVNGVLRHVDSFTGSLPRPYMKTANLPFSVEIINNGVTQSIRFGQFDDSDGIFFEIRRNSAAADFTYICSSARILNGEPYPTVSSGYSRTLTGVGTTLIPLFSMRIGATYNGISSRIYALPTSLMCFAETREGAFSVTLNPTLTDETFAATSPSPAIQIDTAASAMSGGVEVARISLGADASLLFPLDELFTIPGTKIRRQAFTGISDILTIGVIREGTVNFNPRATLNWREVR